ncbi:MAG: methionine-binding protein [Neisseria sp.]|uniref:methionine-binding protein n=1 Tax=Neisseria sp. TaxID=192066 RepID=UPI0026DAE5C4|nr:methionine-binding protein [Neisseria sp.]MDO4248762.1 methionine-binding protein [Neisseria sp.]
MNICNHLICAAALSLLSACVYSETPYGRYGRIDLPVHSETTVNKTVTINAPPGTTVIYGDVTPASAYEYPRRYPYPVREYPVRPVYRLEGSGGSIEQRYERY